MTTDKQFYRKLDFGHDNGDGTFGYASTVTTPFARMLAMDWTAASDTQHDRDMIYAENHSSDSKVAIYLWTRSSDFLESQLLGGAARGVNTLLTHLNGELYYSRYRAGDVWRYDYATNTAKQIFILPHAGLSAFMVMHPTGNYAYFDKTKSNHKNDNARNQWCYYRTHIFKCAANYHLDRCSCHTNSEYQWQTSDCSCRNYRTDK